MIRETESRLVSRLFAFEFFHGAAVALYFTAAITIFLRQIGTVGLPKVYILSAFLLWAFGLIYNFLEHRLSTIRLVIVILFFNGISMLLFRLFYGVIQAPWFLFVFFASFNIFYLLENLEFWGLAALVFDVRQSKRLFAIVSAGDVPAKLIGYTMALIFTTAAGTIDLLWVATACLGVSLMIFLSMAGAESLLALPAEGHHHFVTHSLQSIQAAITGNKLIRRVAFVSFFSFSFYILASYMLYGFVKIKFHSDKSLATFFAIFYGASRGLTLIIKPVFTGRMLDRLGLRKSLLIAPLILIALCIGAFFVSENPNNPLIFYAILVVAVSVDILRSVIELPVLLSTLQPLPVRHRLRGHTIIKGLMDPFAYLAIGVLLLAVMGKRIDLNFALLFVILLAIAMAWMFITFFVDSSYIRMLTAAIRKKTIDERDISLTDTDSLNFLGKRLESGSADEATAVLHLISAQPVNHERFYLRALGHTSREVKHLALRLIQSQNYQGTLPILKKMLEDQPDNVESMPHLIRAMASLDSSADVSGYLSHENTEVAGAAALTMLGNPEPAKRAIAVSYLVTLLESGEEPSQLSALQIISEKSAQEFSPQVLGLFNHPNERIRYQAMLTAGKLANTASLSLLIGIFLDSEKEVGLLEGLLQAGEAALPVIGQAIQSGKCGEAKRRRLYILLGKIGNAEALGLLEKFLQQYEKDTDLLLFMLYQHHFRPVIDTLTYKIFIEETLECAAYNIFRLQFLEQHPGDRFRLFIRALELELSAEKDRLICLFSFLYDDEKIRRVKSGLDLNTKESLANAFELITLAVPREYAIPFTFIFEHAGLLEKCDQLKKHYQEHTVTLEHLIRDVLGSGNLKFNDWTKSCLIYSFASADEPKYEYLVRPYLEARDPILREVAEYVINQQLSEL